MLESRKGDRVFRPKIRIDPNSLLYISVLPVDEGHKRHHLGHRTAMGQEKRSLTELVKRHPLLTTVFGFWGFGYTFMVPNLLGGRFLQAFFHAVGSNPGKVFLGFGALFFMVFLFAGVVPFALWYFVCQALESADTSSQTPKNG